jgi:glycosyltransferase involved in cell wall biosynthesis
VSLKSGDHLEFSVIVPTRGRPQQLRQALEAIVQTDFPHNSLEVVVVADGEGQGLDVVASNISTDIAMRVIEQVQAGPGAARNTGATAARGRYLAFTDDDCLPTPTWLHALKRALDTSPRALIGGQTINSLEGNACSEASQLIQAIVYRHYNGQPDQAMFLASNNMAVGAEEFASLGGFDQAFRFASEDREFCDRWLWQKRPMRYVENAVVRHAHALTVATFFQQHFRYGTGAARYHRARAGRGSGKLVDHVSFHANLDNWLTPTVTGSPQRQVQIRMCLLLWQVANALGFLWENMRWRLEARRR